VEGDDERELQAGQQDGIHSLDLLRATIGARVILRAGKFRPPLPNHGENDYHYQTRHSTAAPAACIMYVCVCNAITEREVRACAEAGMRTVEDLSFALGLGTCCGRCRDCAAGVLAEFHGGQGAQPATRAAEPAVVAGGD
jgi:bacterioferritin-associated ferredoxin